MSQDGSNADKKSADQPDASASRSAFVSYSQRDERYKCLGGQRGKLGIVPSSRWQAGA